MPDVLQHVGEFDLRDPQFVEVLDDAREAEQSGVGRDAPGDVALQPCEGDDDRRAELRIAR